MHLDLELYRYSRTISTDPLVRISVIDVAPDAPQHTFVFIHGFGGLSKQWEPQMRAFAARNRVIAMDLRGHGRSDAPEGGYSMSRILADLELVLEQLEVHQPFVLVGHSFGGAVAVEFAVRHPERLSHLVLAAAAGEFKLDGLRRAGLSLPVPILRLIEPLTYRWLHARVHALKAWYRHIVDPWNGWEAMGRIKTPTLVILGNHDRVFAKAAFERVAETIPNAEVVDLGAAGHLVQLERRDAVNRAIESFVNARQRSWREHTRPGTMDRSDLVAQRPWLKHYEDGVPFTVAVPETCVHNMLRSAVRRFPRQAALFFGNRKISYRRLNHDANRFANLLLNEKLKTGDRVFLQHANHPHLITAFFGTLKAGGIVVLSPETDPARLLEQIADSGARIVFTDSELTGMPENVTAIIRTRFTGGRHVLRTLLFGRSMRTQSRKSPPIEVDADLTAAIIYTGGTTARPKAVMLSHKNLVANALQTRHWMVDHQSGEERFLAVLPYSHSYGLMTGLILPVALAATIILRPNFDAKDTLEAVKQHQPSVFAGVPSIFLALANFPGVRSYGLASIKACLSGSEPLPVEVQEQFEKLTRGRLAEGYGLTEASPVTHVNPLSGQRRTGSIGLPLPSTEARIVDLKTGQRELGAGQFGELLVRGPQVMQGYWNDPEGSRAVLDGDRWLHTGDIALMDEDGYFRIIARKADMWLAEGSGDPAFPRDVEEVLYEIPQVKEAVVIAIAGKPVAFVVPRGAPPPAAELIEYCRRRLPGELVPRWVLFLDGFPRSFIGKILRRELEKRFVEKQHE